MCALSDISSLIALYIVVCKVKGLHFPYGLPVDQSRQPLPHLAIETGTTDVDFCQYSVMASVSIQLRL